VGVSFWVWNHATADQWSAIDEAAAWELPTGRAANGAAAVYLQRVLGCSASRGPGRRPRPGHQGRHRRRPARPRPAGDGKLDAATIRSITGPKL